MFGLHEFWGSKQPIKLLLVENLATPIVYRSLKSVMVVKA